MAQSVKLEFEDTLRVIWSCLWH